MIKAVVKKVLLIMMLALVLFVLGCSEEIVEEVTQEINREVSEQFEKSKEEAIKSAEYEYEEIKKGVKASFSLMIEDLKDWFYGIIGWRSSPKPPNNGHIPEPELEKDQKHDPIIIVVEEHSLLSEEEFMGWDMVESMQAYRDPDNPFPSKGYNCTWFVYGRMLQLGHKKEALDTMRGSANQWAATASKGAYRVDPIVENLIVPSIAYWDAGVGGSDATHGHVAVVERINLDGSITVSESAWGGKAYNVRTIQPNDKQWPSGFILVP